MAGVGDRIETHAIVLRNVAYGDADAVVTLLTRSHGKVACFARGARKSSRRFRGGIGVFSLLEVAVHLKPDGLATLTSSDVALSWQHAGGDLHRLAAGSLVLELADLALRDRQGADDLFERFVRFLGWLADDARGVHVIEAGAHRIQLVLLDELGQLPSLNVSARTGRAVEALEEPHLVPDVGLVGRQELRPGETAWPIGHDGLLYLHQLLSGRFPTEDAPAVRRRVSRSLAAWWSWVVEREPKSLAFYRETFGAQ